MRVTAWSWLQLLLKGLCATARKSLGISWLPSRELTHLRCLISSPVHETSVAALDNGDGRRNTGLSTDPELWRDAHSLAPGASVSSHMSGRTHEPSAIAFQRFLD